VTISFPEDAASSVANDVSTTLKLRNDTGAPE
jgi:hypothetical protein